MTYDDKDLNWIAGFFDGEGSVGLYHQKERPTQLRSGGRARHVLTLTITNTNRDVLDWVSMLFGGVVGQHGGCNMPCDRWRLTGRDKQREFLTRMLPFLRIKKSQAEYALQYLDTVLDDGLGYAPTPEAVLARRSSLTQLIKEEKRK